MNYQETVRYIESLSPTLERPGLQRIEAFLALYGSPQNSFPCLQVGGTNGKGSSAAMLDSILRAKGLRVARYTGPHLLRWNERFHLDGKPIHDADFARRATDLKELSERFAFANPQLGPLTWFEFLTALAFFFFAESKIDLAVIEVGLGGRFDATNVIAKPLVTAITNVSLDHTHILGGTVEEIAREKAGIVKAKVPVVTAAKPPALEIIASIAKELNAPLTRSSTNFEPSRFFGLNAVDDFSQESNSQVYLTIGNRLAGSYQSANLMLVLEILKEASLLPTSYACLKKALEEVYWPGRFQILEPLRLVLDGAHNLAGAQALRESLQKLYPGQKFRFVFACYANKNGPAILQELLTSGDWAYFSEIAGRRNSFSKSALAKYAKAMGVKASTHGSIAQAVSCALNERQGAEYVVATGSFATVKETMIKLGWQTVENGLAIR